MRRDSRQYKLALKAAKKFRWANEFSQERMVEDLAEWLLEHKKRAFESGRKTGRMFVAWDGWVGWR